MPDPAPGARLTSVHHIIMIIQSKHRVEAKTGQGGPEISLVTTNGMIKITK